MIKSFHWVANCPDEKLVPYALTAHHSKSTRTLFTQKTEKFFERLAQQLTGEDTERATLAVSVVSLMVGALQLSRAVTDKNLSEQILKAASKTAVGLTSTMS